MPEQDNSMKEKKIEAAIPPIEFLVNEYYDALAKGVVCRERFFAGVPTGYTELDSMLHGLQPSDLIIIGGCPAAGKTAFALNVVLHAALQANTTVAVFSLEMTARQMVERMLSTLGKVSIVRLRRDYLLEDTDWARLTDAADTLRNAPIYIDDTLGISSLELRSRARKLHKTHNIGMIVVDCLQLMQSSHKTCTRDMELSEISHELKALARELNVPVIVLSQLIRRKEKFDNKRPCLTDLHGSGSIERNADTIMFVYREDLAKPVSKGKAEIIIGKHRNGIIGACMLKFHPAYAAFEDPVDLPRRWRPTHNE
jgi:replicative DNA helicase